MPLKTAPTGTTHPDSGRPWMVYTQDPVNANKVAVYTGAHAKGNYTLADGTSYNVSDDWVETESWEHYGELSHLMGLDYEQNSHPMHKARGYVGRGAGDDDYDPLTDEFHHVCTWHCGEFARTGDQAKSEFDARLTRLGHADAIGTDAYAAKVAQIQGDHARHAALHPKNDGFGGATMALASAAAENAALNGLAGVGSTNVMPDVSLHTATPGTTGASENANSGSYARQACSWNTASGGSMTNSTSLTFATAGSVAVTYIGTWSSATYGAGTYAIGAALTSGVTSTSIAIASGAITWSAS